MPEKQSAKEELIEAPTRIEPARVEEPTEAITDIVAELSATSATLGKALHPRTAANLADVVRMMNTYYSNLIEGHNTRPKDIERALAGKFDDDEQRRNLQIEAAAHVRVQGEVDRMAAENRLPEPASIDFILWLHRAFYRDAPDEMLRIRGADREFMMAPGEWRSRSEHDVMVGRHLPPSSEHVDAFMRHFESRYRFATVGKAGRIMAIAAAHHRLNFVHPFPDGNGRVSRLMSHAMGLSAGIGAHGLWSVSRGPARGLERRGDYKRMMDYADSPRRGDLDGRGNLSRRVLGEFTAWFLRVCLDQVTFMDGLFALDTLVDRLRVYVGRRNLKPEALRLLEQTLQRGELSRGEAGLVTGRRERTARDLLTALVTDGIIGSHTPKGPVSLRFPLDAVEILFPGLFPET